MDIVGLIFGIIFIIFYIFFIVFIVKNRSKFSYNTYKSNINESNLALVILAFLKNKNFNEDKEVSILNEAFETYYEKMHGFNTYLRLDKLYIKYSNIEININPPCIAISNYPTKHKLFLLYNLLDIAAIDKVYSFEEERFIETVRSKIKIPKQTFQAVKAVYSKKGMKDERLIEEEKQRRKDIQSYLPYNAYKILGVTSIVTKAELKKVYRTLAKKYHPDKYYGQSNEMIEKAEDKFQEITKAYEIIVKLKQF